MIRFSQLDNGEFFYLADDKDKNQLLKYSVECQYKDTYVFRVHRFHCRQCGQDVSYSARDYEFHRDHGWICPDCKVIIADGDYPINLKGTKTAFSSMGNALGDIAVQEVVRRKYLEANPDEEVIFLNEFITEQQILEMGLTKLFWANMYMGDIRFLPRSGIWFSLCNEVNDYAAQGIFPEWHNKTPVNGFDKGCNYIVMSMRKVNKAEEKNVDTAHIYAIFKLLKSYINNGIDKIVLVGDDKDSDGLDIKNIGRIIGDLPIIDYRNRISLEQIAYIMDNAMMFIGTDSGMVHLFAASVCAKDNGFKTDKGLLQRMVIWGFQTDRWFPKVPEGNSKAFLRKDSTVEAVLGAIEGYMIIK